MDASAAIGVNLEGIVAFATAGVMIDELQGGIENNATSWWNISKASCNPIVDTPVKGVRVP
jgi:hypothetical protein